MIIDYPQTEMEPCFCGASMNNIALAYGSTPYLIFCEACGVSYDNKITNCDVDGAVRAWNEFRHGGDNKYKIKAIIPNQKGPSQDEKAADAHARKWNGNCSDNAIDTEQLKRDVSMFLAGCANVRKQHQALTERYEKLEAVYNICTEELNWALDNGYGDFNFDRLREAIEAAEDSQ